MRVDRDRVIAFRANAHHLNERLEAGRLEEAAACGIQNTPPTSASAALWARVADVGPYDVEHALVDRKTLLQAWSLRGAPYVFPTNDAAVFTRALLPPDEKALRFFITGVEPSLARIGMTATALADLAEGALWEALDGRTITSKRALDRALARQLREHLNPRQRAEWDSPSPFAKDQTLGEAVASFALRPVALRGVVCFAARQGNQASFVRTDQWLGGRSLGMSERAARTELTRRYLRAYGPSTAKAFAEWTGTHQDQASAAFSALDGDLVEVEYAGKPAWILQEDKRALESPPSPKGVRLLPPLDPWVLLRDRETILPETQHRGRVWRRQGWPGTVLVDGVLVGIWRARRKGQELELRVDTFHDIPERARGELDDEAGGLAALRECDSAMVTID